MPETAWLELGHSIQLTSEPKNRSPLLSKDYRQSVSVLKFIEAFLKPGNGWEGLAAALAYPLFFWCFNGKCYAAYYFEIVTAEFLSAAATS